MAMVSVISSLILLITRRERRLLYGFCMVAGALIGFRATIMLPQTITEWGENLRQNRGISGRPTVQEKAIPINPNGISASDAHTKIVDWAERTLVKPYEEHGRHNAAWDDMARQLIRGSAFDFLGAPGGFENAHWRSLARDIRHAGCNDPWILLLCHRVEQRGPDDVQLTKQYAADLSRAGYTGFPLLVARMEAWLAISREDSLGALDVRLPCQEALRAALASRSPDGKDDWIWSEFFSGKPASDVMDLDARSILNVIDSTENLPEWVKLRVRGNGEIALAWKSRGSGWANTVGKDQWHGFEQHLALARSTLEQCWKLNPSQPAAAKSMVTVALGATGRSEMRQWFDRAVEARFDYIPAYNRYRNGLLPRWFGSHDDLLAFGRACLATKRFDTEVPWQMYLSVRNIAAELDQPDSIYRNNDVWRDLKTMFDGYEKDGDPAFRSRYLSAELLVAERRGMHDLVARLAQELHYKLDPGVAEDWYAIVESMGRTMTYAGPAGETTAAAEREETAHPENALALLQRAQSLPNLHPLAVRYLAHRSATIRTGIDLHRLPWQRIPLSNNLAGWKRQSGDWHTQTPYVLELKPNTGDAMLIAPKSIGDTWELRGEFCLTHPNSGRSEATLFFGPLEEKVPRWMSLRFWMRADGEAGLTLARNAREESLNRLLKRQDVNKFMVCVIDHRVTVHVNGYPWVSDQPLPDGVAFDAKTQLGFGAIAGSTCPVQFRNLEFRSLTDTTRSDSESQKQ